MASKQTIQNNIRDLTASIAKPNYEFDGWVFDLDEEQYREDPLPHYKLLKAFGFTEDVKAWDAFLEDSPSAFDGVFSGFMSTEYRLHLLEIGIYAEIEGYEGCDGYKRGDTDYRDFLNI